MNSDGRCATDKAPYTLPSYSYKLGKGNETPREYSPSHRFVEVVRILGVSNAAPLITKTPKDDGASGQN